MSIHHLDTFRYWFGTPDRVLASTRPDPRTKFPHTDGINLYILEYDNGARARQIRDALFARQQFAEGDLLAIRPGELITFLGPSGCGKTTLLRIIAGLETQDTGNIIQGGRDISRLR